MAEEAEPTTALVYSGLSKALAAFIAIVGGLLGMVVGGVTMWITLSDRMERKVELRVTERMKLSNDIVRLSEKSRSLESTVWVLQGQISDLRNIPRTSTAQQASPSSSPIILRLDDGTVTAKPVETKE